MGLPFSQVVNAHTDCKGITSAEVIALRCVCVLWRPVDIKVTVYKGRYVQLDSVLSKEAWVLSHKYLASTKAIVYWCYCSCTPQSCCTDHSPCTVGTTCYKLYWRQTSYNTCLPAKLTVLSASVLQQDESRSPHWTVTLFTNWDGMTLRTELKFEVGGFRTTEIRWDW